MGAAQPRTSAGPVLAVTLGDINGIGPEVALKAARRRPRGMRLVLVGSQRILGEQAAALGLPPPTPATPDTFGKRGLPGVVCWDPGSPDRLHWRPGHLTAAASRAALAWVAAAADGCLRGLFDGMVTGPLCKEGLQRAGCPWPGHTEYIAHLTGTKRFAMLLTGGGLRVVLATRHLPLREVPRQLNRKALMDAIGLTCEALPWLAGKKGPVGVCGLNPHAGDGGVLGREERDLIAPTVRAARRRGWPVEGPVPADVIFYQALQGRYEAVIAMYHDQGLAPLKTLAFDRGVNLTLGLPLLRTSPDHGTAYDLAGRGTAREDSMLEALRLAGKLAAAPLPWRRPGIPPTPAHSVPS